VRDKPAQAQPGRRHPASASSPSATKQPSTSPRSTGGSGRLR